MESCREARGMKSEGGENNANINLAVWQSKGQGFSQEKKSFKFEM